MTNNDWVLLGAGAAIGATAMCLLDSGRGGSRRALVRNKVVRATHKTGDALDALGHDVYNRARGVAAETWSAVHQEPVSSRKLIERVRSELGRVVSHPRPIDVHATDDGCVALVGPILSDEADSALAAVSGVRGVCSVEDRLERHDSAEGVPSLQGGRVRPGRRSALTQDSWSPATKALVCIASTALAAGLGYATLAPDHDEAIA